MSLRADRREWDDLAERDAMWAVCSDPEMRGRWSAEEFFASGETEVAGAMDGLAREGLAPERTRRALDFGCGLGRLTRALSTRFDEVVGVDLSEEMVAEATRLNSDRPNVTFLANDRPDLSLLPGAQFDLVFSLIALQHVSSREAIEAYLREFVRVTAPGGVIAFQLPAAVGWQIRAHPLRLANRALRRLPRAPGFLLRALMPYSMSLTAVPEERVRAALSGTTVEAVFPDARGGSPVVKSLFYVARRA